MVSECRQSGLIWLGITRTVDFQKHGNERVWVAEKAQNFLTRRNITRFSFCMDLVKYKANLSCAPRNLIEKYLGHEYWHTSCWTVHRLLSHTVEDCDPNFLPPCVWRLAINLITKGLAGHSRLQCFCTRDNLEWKKADSPRYWHFP
jgi:hypothetical protein